MIYTGPMHIRKYDVKFGSHTTLTASESEICQGERIKMNLHLFQWAG